MNAARRWLAATGSGVVLGLVVGVPYYSLPYFYDYFGHSVADGGHGWSRAEVVLGLPAGTLVTLVMGPALSRRLPARTGVTGGAVLCAAAVAGFGSTNGSLTAYYGLWVLYMVGWSFAGPMTHQVILTQMFHRNRGLALAVALFGLSLFGAASVAFLASPLTQAFGFRVALRLMGAFVLIAAPVAWLTVPVAKTESPPDVFRRTAGPLPQRSGRCRDFWLLLAGSTLTTAGIAGVSQHLKLILRERGFLEQRQLDEVFGWTVLIMLVSGAAGRFAFGWCADRFPKRRLITVAFLLMVLALVLLYFVGNGVDTPYLFALCFGLGMSSDTLLTALLAAERFDSEMLGRAMAVLVPVNTIGQTWFPFLISLLWELSSNYTLALVLIFLCILGGRMALILVPECYGKSV